MLYTKHITITDTTEQTVFAVPNGYVCHINYIFVANHGGSTNQVDLFWDLSSVPQVYVFDGTPINGGSKETLGGQSDKGIFVLHEGETVKAQTSGSGNVEVAVTFDLLPKPNVLVNFNGS